MSAYGTTSVVYNDVGAGKAFRDGHDPRETATTPPTAQSRLLNLEERLSAIHAILDQVGGPVPTKEASNLSGNGLMATIDRVEQMTNHIYERLRYVADQIGSL